MRSGLDLQKEMLKALSEKEMSLRELETTLNTNYNTVRAYAKMLAFYGLVEIVEHERSDANGRPFRSVRLTTQGRALVAEKQLAR